MLIQFYLQWYGENENDLSFGLLRLSKNISNYNEFWAGFFSWKIWRSVHENNLNQSLFRIRHNNKKNLKRYFQLSLFFVMSLMCLLIESNFFLDQRCVLIK